MNKMIQDIIISNKGVVPFYAALHSKWEDAKFTIQLGDTEEWSWDEGNNEARPTDAEVQTEIDRLQAQYDAQEYARNRATEYPDWGSQLNKIYDDGLTKWKAEMVDPIKAKYPKP
jgi:hypothetical protein